MTDFLGKDIENQLVQEALKHLESAGKFADSVYAEAVAPRWAVWAKGQYGAIRKASWWQWLFHRPMRNYELEYTLPGDDHVEYRELDGRRYRISQPYQILWGDLCDMVRFCKENGLKVHIHGRSWYYPGSTIVVVMEPANDAP